MNPSPEDFAEHIRSVLDKGNTAQALSIFIDIRNADNLKDNSCQLISLLFVYLTSEYASNHKDIFKCCEMLLWILTEQSSPQRALIQIKDEIARSNDDMTFHALLKPLSKILYTVPQRNLDPLICSLNAIEVFLKRVPPTRVINLAVNRKILMARDERTVRINELYTTTAAFYDIIISEAKLNTTEHKTKIIQKYLINLLGGPIAHLDMDNIQGITNKSSSLAQFIVRKALELFLDPMHVLKINLRHTNDIFRPHFLGVAILFYLLFAMQVRVGSYPMVYAPEYILKNTLYLVTELLKTQNQISAQKGLDLATALFKPFTRKRIPYSLFDTKDHDDFIEALSELIANNKMEHIKRRGLEVLKDHLWLFDIHGFYILVDYYIHNETNSYLIGYVVTQYKDLLSQELIRDTKISVYCKDLHLHRVLKQLCQLARGPKTDLARVTDQTLSSLYLLKFLAVHDKTNCTNIWGYLPQLEVTYLLPLTKALKYSRSVYEEKVREWEGGMVCCRDLQHLDSSLNWFDVMERVSTSLLELIKDRKEH